MAKYTLLIADDEEIECKALRLLVQKELPEIEVVGVARNGVELVSMAQKLRPDIATVDVNMPGMSGIDAIGLLSSCDLPTRFVICTAYDEFEYVHRALALKVDAYILKPERRDATAGTLRKLCAEIETTRSNNQSQSQIRALFTNIQPVLEREILYSLFIGEASEDSFETYCEMHGCRFSAGAVAVLLPVAGDAAGLREQDRQVLRAALDGAFGGSCTYRAAVTESSVCLLIFVEPAPAEAQRRWLGDVLRVALDKLNRTLSLPLRAGVGGVYTAFRQMSDSYREALSALREHADGGISFHPETASPGQSLPEGLTWLDKPPEEPAEEPAENPGYVQQALRYMSAHYAEDISLDTVAGCIGISPSYLSRLFSTEQGRSFVECLTELRIRAAVELACETRLSIREIAQRAGYSNVTYFCRVFKRHAGCTITELRERRRNNDNKRRESFL